MTHPTPPGRLATSPPPARNRPAWRTVLAALLVAAGLDFAVTGALGHCPLYHKLGYVPPSLRSTR